MASEMNYVVAIDIGTSNIVTLVGQKVEGGKIKIVSSSITPSNGMVRGDVRNVEQLVGSIEESIKAIADKEGIKICEAYVGLSGQHVKCSQHSGYVFIKNKDSEVSRGDVDELSESMRNIQVGAGETIIHILPRNYILDGDSDISHPVGMIGTKLEGKFNIVVSGKQNLAHLERCLNRAQIDIAEVVLNSIASAEAVLLDDEKELGVVVVDIGGGTSDVCIYFDKTVRYMGVIAVGGNFINKDIKSYGVLERHVEKLKVKFGNAMSDNIESNNIITLASINNIPTKEIAQKELAAIIEARMMDIIENLEQILNSSDFKDKLKGPIVLTGGGSNLQDIDKLFEKHLKRAVRIATPTLYVTEDSAEFVNGPQYSTAVGLLLKGISIGLPTKTISLNKSVPLTVQSPSVQEHLAQQKFAQEQNDYTPQVPEKPEEEEEEISEEIDDQGGYEESEKSRKSVWGRFKNWIVPEDVEEDTY